MNLSMGLLLFKDLCALRGVMWEDGAVQYEPQGDLVLGRNDQ